jgi:hypothetical protein
MERDDRVREGAQGPGNAGKVGPRSRAHFGGPGLDGPGASESWVLTCHLCGNSGPWARAAGEKPAVLYAVGLSGPSIVSPYRGSEPQPGEELGPANECGPLNCRPDGAS